MEEWHSGIKWHFSGFGNIEGDSDKTSKQRSRCARRISLTEACSAKGGAFF